jgi:hypothetical protein
MAAAQHDVRVMWPTGMCTCLHCSWLRAGAHMQRMLLTQPPPPPALTSLHHTSVSASSCASGTTVLTRPMSCACCASYSRARNHISRAFFWPTSRTCNQIRGTSLLDCAQPSMQSAGPGILEGLHLLCTAHGARKDIEAVGWRHRDPTPAWLSLAAVRHTEHYGVQGVGCPHHGASDMHAALMHAALLHAALLTICVEP